MATNKLRFIAKIESLGAIDRERRQTIQLKDVASMSGYFFNESDGFVEITIEKPERVEFISCLNRIKQLALRAIHDDISRGDFDRVVGFFQDIISNIETTMKRLEAEGDSE